MEERIYTYQVTAKVEAMQGNEVRKIHLLMTDEKFSVDYTYYDTAEKALESFLSFMNCYYKGAKCSFESTPYIYEVTNARKSISAYRLEGGLIENDACFLLDSFGKYSINDMAMFLKEYCESDYSEEFTRISLFPSIKAEVRRIDLLVFPKNLTVEEIKERLLETNLIGYLHL